MKKKSGSEEPLAVPRQPAPDPAVDCWPAQAMGSCPQTVAGRLITIMALSASHFWAQLSMHVVKIISQTCSDEPQASTAGVASLLLKQTKAGLTPLKSSSSKGLIPSSSFRKFLHLCLVSALCLSLPRLHADSNSCCGVGPSPMGCLPTCKLSGGWST